ncbi:MAG: DDE-type integrase/transposase/recombinase, partial [Deltaproteobacteria bacterium]|nr:DDE-type integrase/transposase/recombinase [Deltaproteobacteria bacterium]
MQAEWTADQISKTLGISRRAVQQRATKEVWSRISKTARGGRKTVYITALLPDAVRGEMALKLSEAGKLTASAGASAEAGHVRGEALAEEKLTAIEARQRAKEQGLKAYAALPAARKQEAEARFEILNARDGFLKATRLPLKRGTELFCRELVAGGIRLSAEVIGLVASRGGRPGLSWSTVRRWQQAFDESGMAGTGNATCSIPEHMQTFIQAMLTDFPHVSVAYIRKGLEARYDGQTIPHPSSVRRYVAKWKEENVGLLLFIKNPDEWKNKLMNAVGDASEHIERLNQLWEFDGTPTDVMLINGRHNITGVIDVYTRRVKLLVSPTAKSESVAGLTRRALIDWGVPEVAKTDNGADYVSKHMVRVFTSLEIEQQLCPPFSPEKKPHIERFFRTFSHGLVELLPGYVGHNINDRKAIEARRTFAQRLMSQGHDPIDIKMTADEFQQLCDDWCNAMYHHEPHSSLGGKTPMEMVREWTDPVRRITDERALDVLLYVTPDGDGLRKIGKKGVKVHRGHYYAYEMIGHEDEYVRVLCDPTDFGVVYCYQQAGEFLCRAVDLERKGIDRAELAAKARREQKRVYSEGSQKLKKQAKKMDNRFIYREMVAHNKAKIENVVELPKPATEYTTEALGEAARTVEAMDQAGVSAPPVGI